jgi:hypothetical protein
VDARTKLRSYVETAKYRGDVSHRLKQLPISTSATLEKDATPITRVTPKRSAHNRFSALD